MVFLDTDMLITKPLVNIFDQRFDVGATWRKDTDQPVNGGIIFVKGQKLEIGKIGLLLQCCMLRKAPKCCPLDAQTCIETADMSRDE